MGSGRPSRCGCGRAISAILVAVVAGCSSPSVAPATSSTAPATTTTSVATSTTSPSTSTCTSTVPSTTTTTTPATTTTKPPVTTTTTPPVTTTKPPVTTVPGASSQMLWSLPVTGRKVALTFDAGSDLGYTAMILDILAANHVTASFGLTGVWARQNPSAVRRIAADGHQVINHTDTHHSFTGASAPDPLLTTAERLADLAKAEATLTSLTGRPCSPFWRPPYGDTDASVLRDVASAGYAYTVMWTVDSHGWMGLSADGIVDRILTNATPGAILAFHVGSASEDAFALQRIIDGLRADGYSFVTIAQGLHG